MDYEEVRELFSTSVRTFDTLGFWVFGFWSIFVISHEVFVCTCVLASDFDVLGFGNFLINNYFYDEISRLPSW